MRLRDPQIFYLYMQTKSQKQEKVQEFEQYLKDQQGMVFVDVQGIKVKEIATLRRSLKHLGAKLTVIKKTLFQKALEKSGKDFSLKELQGQIAAILAFEDILPALKEAKLFSKKQPLLQMKGGYYEGEFQPASRMLELANIPTRPESLTMLTYVLQGNIKGLMRVLSQIKAE